MLSPSSLTVAFTICIKYGRHTFGPEWTDKYEEEEKPVYAVIEKNTILSLNTELVFAIRTNPWSQLSNSDGLEHFNLSNFVRTVDQLHCVFSSNLRDNYTFCSSHNNNNMKNQCTSWHLLISMIIFFTNIKLPVIHSPFSKSFRDFFDLKKRHLNLVNIFLIDRN